MTTQFKQLINPHSHSESSLDGASTIESIVKRNKKLGATHVCTTEHGNMNACVELYTSAAKHGVKPILGIELYLVPPNAEYIREQYWKAFQAGTLKTKAKAENIDKVRDEIEKKVKNYYFHLTVHFKTFAAYQHFCGLSPAMNERAVVKWGEVKPMATIEELVGIRDQITICSSCMIGPVARTFLGSQDKIIPPNPEMAEQFYCMLRELAGPGNFFVEIFPHPVTHNWEKAKKEGDVVVTPGRFVPHECTPDLPDGDLQKKMNLFLIQLASKYNDKIIVSLDSHFAEESDKVIQDAKLGNGQENWKFYNSYHVMSSDEAYLYLAKSLGVDVKTFEGWIDNSYEFASLFNDFKMPTAKDRWLLSEPPEDFMVQLKAKIDNHGRMDWDNPAMMDRLKKEIQVLAFNPRKNLMEYFFIVEDIANFCRNNDVLMNVRGSAGGSLLLYLLGVSAINPLDYNLTFERFLTEGRIKANTLPDVDMDISDQEKVFEYLRGKYGNRFSRISTDTLLHLKSSIKDAERFHLGDVRPETEKLTKVLPGTPQNTDDHKFVFGYDDAQGNHTEGLIDTHAGLKAYAEGNPEIWATVTKMLGIQRNKSVHACGVIIAPEPLTNYMPLINVNGTQVTGYSPESIEAIGGVKLDLLGLNTLRDIQLCVRSIKDRLGVDVVWNKLPYDELCIQKFAQGLTAAMFQFDTPTVRPLVVSIVKPEKIRNVIDAVECMSGITSLGRPGTLDAPSGDGRTLAEVYMARANGEPVSYIGDALAPIMGVTLGIQLYQEQTLQIFRDIAGMSYEEAEVVRRAIGKKDAELLNKNFGRLREGCTALGWVDSQVDLLIEQIKASSRYSFNKSHAASYALVAYACLWLRENYPLDWWKAVLSNSDKEELVSKFWPFVRNFVKMPDVNNPHQSYQVVGETLVAPIGIIAGVGPKAYEALVGGAPYADLQDFVEKHFGKADGERGALNMPLVCKLIVAGILDTLYAPGASRTEKLQMFLDLKREVTGKNLDKKTRDMVSVYTNLSSLGEYLVKKQLVKSYSLDLRELLLPNRGGYKDPNQDVWIGKSAEGLDAFYFDAWFLERQKDNALQGRAAEGELRLVGYIVDEKAKQYANKTKQATNMMIDINGTFYEEMLWPEWETNVAKSGFKGLPCVLVYKCTRDRISLKKVIPMITRESLENLDKVS